MSPGGGAMVAHLGLWPGACPLGSAAPDLVVGAPREGAQASPWTVIFGGGIMAPGRRTGRIALIPRFGRRWAMHEGLGEWCERWLGSAISDVLFETGSLSAVTGVRLADSREVVVKVRRCVPHLNAAYLVQRHVWQCGYPAPEPLVPPVPVGGADCASAEQLVGGGDIGGRGRGDAGRSAEALAWLLRTTPAIADVGDLSPAPPWIAWDHAGPRLWPAPDGRPEGLDTVAGPGWLDDAGLRARERLGRYRAPRVIGHGDWHAENVRWSGNKLLVVHDWDSVVYQPEAVVAGVAA